MQLATRNTLLMDKSKRANNCCQELLAQKNSDLKMLFSESLTGRPTTQPDGHISANMDHDPVLLSQISETFWASSKICLSFLEV